MIYQVDSSDGLMVSVGDKTQQPKNKFAESLEWQPYSGLGETGSEQEWSSGTEFSGCSDFPEYWVSSKFSEILPGTVLVPLDS